MGLNQQVGELGSLPLVGGSVAQAPPAGQPPRVSTGRSPSMTGTTGHRALGRARAAVRALRPHQWAKNLLVFLPVLTSHRVLERLVLGQAVMAFVAFGLVASSVYVVNDLADLDADRQHPRKRRRPFASGALPVAVGYVLVPLLLGGAAAVAIGLPPAFRLLLLGYLVVTTAYSFLLKRQPVVDALILAGLYTMRIFAGGFATGILVSEWLASFSMFFFLSLAFLKRASELVATEGAPKGRGYRPDDETTVFAMGTSSGYISVLVLALYLSSPEVRILYSHPQVLWGLCPLALYWVSRIWLRGRRGEVDDDPVSFALKDPATYVVGALAAVLVYIGT